jgi:lipoate-protein ligase A
VGGPYRLWCDPLPRPGWLNMAIDTILLERAGEGERWLRLYAWEPSLSFGRHEPAARRYERRAIEASAIGVVRRPTGGRAVWHAGELTYAVSAPAASLGALREAYREIHLMLRDAIRRLGAPAELAPARHARARAGAGAGVAIDAGACFAGSVGGEVLICGRKVAGSAQVRHGAGLLQHGSVLLEGDQALVGRVTLGQAPPDRSATLSEALGRPVEWGEAAAAVVAAAAAAWGAADATAGAEPVLARAAELGEFFRSPAWTWEGTWAADATRSPC